MREHELLPEWAMKKTVPCSMALLSFLLSGASHTSEGNNQMIRKILEAMTAEQTSGYLRRAGEVGKIEVIDKLCLDTAKHQCHQGTGSCRCGDEAEWNKTEGDKSLISARSTGEMNGIKSFLTQ